VRWPSDVRVVGFDYRVAPEHALGDITSTWPDDRRSLYLLRQDVEFVLSADDRAWPSAFPDAAEFDYPDSDFLCFRSLDEILARLRSLDVGHDADGAFIALTEHCQTAHWPRAQAASGVNRAILLGFDVTDPGGLSCLMNYGFNERPAALVAIRRRFGGALNQVHLFSKCESALEYAAFMESDREPGHGPYCAIGIWRLLLQAPRVS
jgi:hypothetical protein